MGFLVFHGRAVNSTTLKLMFLISRMGSIPVLKVMLVSLSKILYHNCFVLGMGHIIGLVVCVKEPMTLILVFLVHIAIYRTQFQKILLIANFFAQQKLSEAQVTSM